MKADNFRESESAGAYLYVLTPRRRRVAEKKSLTTTFLGQRVEEYELSRLEVEALKGEINSSDSSAGPESRSGCLFNAHRLTSSD